MKMYLLPGSGSVAGSWLLVLVQLFAIIAVETRSTSVQY